MMSYQQRGHHVIDKQSYDRMCTHTNRLVLETYWLNRILFRKAVHKMSVCKKQFAMCVLIYLHTTTVRVILHRTGFRNFLLTVQNTRLGLNGTCICCNG